MLHCTNVSAMRPGKAIAVAVLSGCLALLVAACGSTIHPARGRGVVDSPITAKNNHLACLQQKHLPVIRTSPISLQIGPLPAGPTVVFEPTPGAAQALQIDGVPAAAGAEVIGQALLYPHQGSDGELKQIETCLSKGVSG